MLGPNFRPKAVIEGENVFLKGENERLQSRLEALLVSADHERMTRQNAERGRERLRAALIATRKLVSEAAMTGFNCHDGDWAERLFANQASISAALAAADEKLSGETKP